MSHKTVDEVLDRLVESFEVILDSDFEDSDVSEVELQKARRSFKLCFAYLVSYFVDNAKFDVNLFGKVDLDAKSEEFDKI